MTTSKPTISMSEASRRLGVSTQTAIRAVRLGQLKAARIGAHQRVFSDSVDALLARNNGIAGTSLAAVQMLTRELMGISASAEQAGRICVLLGFTATAGSVDRAVLDRLRAAAELPAKAAMIRGICAKGKAV